MWALAFRPSVRSRLSRAAVIGLAAALLSVPPLAAGLVEVVVNDAHVKDRRIEGAVVAAAPGPEAEPVAEETTDVEGLAALDLEPGRWYLDVRRSGYVSVWKTPIEVGEAAGRTTVSLSPLMEAENAGSRRVRFILNWGSDSDDVKDADSHLETSVGSATRHVYFGEKTAEVGGGRIELDVDDIDWGGPETITLVDPPPGAYRYWVHDYSGGRGHLASSEVVVRVLFDDEQVAELRPREDLEGRVWRPLASLQVEADLRPRLVRHTAEELAAGADGLSPPGYHEDEELPTVACGSLATCGGLLVALVPVIVVMLVLRRRGRRRRGV